MKFMSSDVSQKLFKPKIKGKSVKAGLATAAVALLLGGCQSGSRQKESKKAQQEDGTAFPIKVSDNHRYFVDQSGKPFFWLGDTGWLILSKLRQGQVDSYLEDRADKGFNVIQVMVIHDLAEENADGRTALINKDLSRPDTATAQGGHILNYWQGLDSLVVKADSRHMLVALVPVWGSVVKSGKVSSDQATSFARFLAHRYHSAKNVIWLNGGDIPGSDSLGIWQAIGTTIKSINPQQLMSFHPRGRTQSSTWFQTAEWLDFNVFQSGHRRYDQDNESGSLRYGEDNYKYVLDDYQKKPIKPTLDAEPSYEGIPQGLHDSLQPRWDAASIRRYAYWSVFAGACGFTYGANAVMQFYDPSTGLAGAYGVTKSWQQGLQDTAAGQMIYLKTLMLSKPYLTRVPDTVCVLDQGEKYNYVAATKGPGYAMFYTPNGRAFKVDLSELQLNHQKVNISWFDPRTGEISPKEAVITENTYDARPPGQKGHGNDWVLVLQKAG
ncbi:glycoside hydrolase family 140 protein [Arachidicoccus rhizosphaerae]|nr:glycoside hydrolase family 140 protein [Arachidicoccus rhizosphaerae]